MDACPLCEGRTDRDPESGWRFCFGCGTFYGRPQAARCPGLTQERNRATRTPYAPREHP
jgi:hypothetical protein